MRWLLGGVACIIAAGAGCASRESDVVIGMTMMQDAEAQPTLARRRAGAVVEKTLLVNARRQPFPDHTLLRVRGEKADFRVLTGPLGPEWHPPLAANAQEAPEDPPAQGAFHNPDGEWEVGDGYAYMWGWWPEAITRSTSIGTDGSELIVLVDKRNGQEIIALLEGTVSSFKKRFKLDANGNTVADGTEFPPEVVRPAVGQYIIVSGTLTTPTVSPPANIPANVNDRIRKAIDEAKSNRKVLERW